MKTLTFLLIVSLSLSTFVANAQETDAVKKANNANDKKADKELVDEDVAEFLVKSADARMMDRYEGQLASKKATSPALRQYGQQMISDQAMLLKKIKDMAAERHITLPKDISNKKEDGREDLAEKQGKDFDEKFIKMMIIDHERDIKIFQKATSCKDKKISQFAKENLPLIQSHLDKIKAIEKSLE